MKTPFELAHEFIKEKIWSKDGVHYAIAVETYVEGYDAGYQVGVQSSHEQIKSLQKLVHECQQELKAKEKTIEELKQKFGCIY